MSEIAASVAVGFLFGWALHKAGLTHYARIVNLYRLRDATVKPGELAICAFD